MKLARKRMSDGTPIVSIVSDSIIMQRNFADGKSIPLIIIDTEDKKEIERSIELHSGVKEGEVQFTWGRTPDFKYILLYVESISPVEIKYMIAFELYKHCALLDIVLKSHLLYVQAGKKGDKLRDDLNKPKLLFAIPQSSYEVEITRLSQKAKMKRFRDLNVERKDLKDVVKKFNEEWGNFTAKRFK